MKLTNITLITTTVVPVTSHCALGSVGLGLKLCMHVPGTTKDFDPGPTGVNHVVPHLCCINSEIAH